MTSALDMPEIMSYIYSKSWKLQFSASSSIIIIEDYYLQTFLHSLYIPLATFIIFVVTDGIFSLTSALIFVISTIGLLINWKRKKTEMKN